MRAGSINESRTKRVAQAALRALLACAMLPMAPRASAQTLSDIPVLTVPTGAPPAPPANPGLNLQRALEALQAAGSGQALDPALAGPAGAEPLPRPNPFALQSPAPPAGQSLLLPFNPARSAENVAVNDDQDGLISLQVRQGSLRQVVAMIAETQKLNIVFAGPSDTMVSATFERQPWQTVLDALLSSSGHTWTTQGDVIFVASLDVADFMPPDAGGQQVEVFELDFASAVDVDQAVKGLLSPAGKSWLTESNSEDNRRTKEAIAVIDYPPYLARISQYVCQADQPPRQVFIQVHILQVELKDDCRNGINFQHLIGLSGADVRLGNVGFASETPTSAFTVGIEGVGLDGLIELLQNTTDAKTLASPEIHAVSGQTSKMQIGAQLPYRNTATTQTASLQTAQFLDVGVVLQVTPRVTRDGRVVMRIKPEVSTGEYLPEAEGLPSKKTTQVETDVMMASGQGMVLGGLIQEEDSNVQSKLPWFGDLPYIGVLFQKRQVVRGRREIIVTLRPYVLPYSGIMEAQQEAKMWRTEQPLTQGAICRYPRPYEPRMPDTFEHHDAKQVAYALGNPEFYPPGDMELMMLPPVEETLGDVVEELPPGAAMNIVDPQSAPPEPALQ